MKKQVLLLMCLVAFPLFGQRSDIDIQLDAPDQVVAGTEFQVNITFNKGDLKDYSRFSQDLPKGFTATNVNSPNADFTFSENRVRIIWLKLPVEDQVKVSYLIRSHPRISGNLELTGTFAYVDDGERAFLNIATPRNVTITPNQEIDQSLVVSIEDFASLEDPDNTGAVSAEVLEQADFANVVRQTPHVEPNGIVNVTMLVKKPAGTNFLKIEESIPGGYTFEAVESNNAVVSQAASIARFVWMRPPDVNAFYVRYKLIPILERAQEPLIIEGNLTFTESGQTKLAETREVDMNIIALNSNQQEELLKTGRVSGEIADNVVTDKPQIEQQLADGGAASAQRRVTQNANDASSGQPGIKESGVSGSTASSGRTSGASTYIHIDKLEPSSGVYFRVQVAAVRNPLFTTVFFADYDLLRDVKQEKLQGWHKYTVGPYLSYRDAAAMKERVVRETPVENAFVVAYRDGKRVPVESIR